LFGAHVADVDDLPNHGDVAVAAGGDVSNGEPFVLPKDAISPVLSNDEGSFKSSDKIANHCGEDSKGLGAGLQQPDLISADDGRPGDVGDDFSSASGSMYGAPSSTLRKVLACAGHL